MNWREVELFEITNFIKRGISPKYVEDGGFPIINQKCIRGNVVSMEFSRLCSNDKKIPDEKYIKVGDVLVNSTGAGTLGRTGWVKELNEPTTVDTHVTIVRPNKNIVSDKFLALYLSLKEVEIESMGKGATNQTELSASILGTLKINLPPITTQKRIANILSSYDDLIENNLKRIKLLEETAQNIYKEWFVNFRFPNYQHTKFDEESGLPKGWRKGKVADLCEVKSGFAFKSKDWETEGNPVMKIKNISNNTVDILDCDYVNDEVAKNAEKFELFEGDVLIAMTGATVGKVGLIPKIDKRIYINQRVGLFRPFTDEKNNVYLVFAFFMTDEAQKQILNFAGGAAQPNISSSQISEVELNIGSDEILKVFESKIQSIMVQIQTLYSQNQKLKEARNILLPRLMNRTIEV